VDSFDIFKNMTDMTNRTRTRLLVWQPYSVNYLQCPAEDSTRLQWTADDHVRVYCNHDSYCVSCKCSVVLHDASQSAWVSLAVVLMYKRGLGPLVLQSLVTSPYLAFNQKREIFRIQVEAC
jgi:hypothetical protein